MNMVCKFILPDEGCSNPVPFLSYGYNATFFKSAWNVQFLCQKGGGFVNCIHSMHFSEK